MVILDVFNQQMTSLSQIHYISLQLVSTGLIGTLNQIDHFEMNTFIEMQKIHLPCLHAQV